MHIHVIKRLCVYTDSPDSSGQVSFLKIFGNKCPLSVERNVTTTHAPTRALYWLLLPLFDNRKRSIRYHGYSWPYELVAFMKSCMETWIWSLHWPKKACFIFLYYVDYRWSHSEDSKQNQLMGSVSERLLVYMDPRSVNRQCLGWSFLSMDCT